MDNQPTTIHPLQYLKNLWDRKVTCGAIVLVLTTGALCYALMAPKNYQSEAVILPIQPTHPGAAAASGASPLLSLFAGTSASRAETRFMIVLNSDAFRRQVVEALGLWKDEIPIEEAAARLGGHVSITSDLSYPDVLSIAAVSEDPEFAAKLVKQYVVELQNFLSTRSFTASKRYRLYLEDQLARNKEELLEMSKALSAFYGENPVSTVRAKVNVPIALNTVEGSRGFASYEEFKRNFDAAQKTDNNSKEVRIVPDVPHQVYLKYLTIEQQVLEGNYMSLTNSYEQAKMEEAREEPSFQILQEPLVPRRHFSPQRRKIVGGTFLASLLLALVYGFFAPQLLLILQTSRAEGSGGRLFSLRN